MLSPANSNNLIIPPPAERVGKIIAEVISKTFDSDLESPLGSPHFGNGYVPRFGELAKAAATRSLETREVDPRRIDIQAECEITEEFIRSADKEFLKVLENIESGNFKSVLSKNEIQELKAGIWDTRNLIEQARVGLREFKQNKSIDNFQALNQVIEKLIGKREAISQLFPPDSASPKFKLLNELGALSTGLAAMLWSLLLELKIVSAAAPFVIWVPFIAGAALIVGRTAHLVKIHVFDQRRIEDKRNLLSIYDSLIDSLKKEQDEMYDTSVLSTLLSQNRMLNLIFRGSENSVSVEEPPHIAQLSNDSTVRGMGEAEAMSATVIPLNKAQAAESIARMMIQLGLVDENTSASGILAAAQLVAQAASSQIIARSASMISNGEEPLVPGPSATPRSTPVIDEAALTHIA